MATPKKAPEDRQKPGPKLKPTEDKSVRLNATTVPPEIAAAVRDAGGVRAVIQEWYERRGK